MMCATDHITVKNKDYNPKMLKIKPQTFRNLVYSCN